MCVDSGRWLLSADFVAHQMGCNAVSWMSSAIPESLINASGTVANTIRALASGGCDNLVKIWRYISCWLEDLIWIIHLRCSADKIWDNEPEFILEGHSDWVRDVSFAPNIGLPGETLASCSQVSTRQHGIWCGFRHFAGQDRVDLDKRISRKSVEKGFAEKIQRRVVACELVHCGKPVGCIVRWQQSFLMATGS